MDDLEKEMIKASAEIVLKPIGQVFSDVVGLTGGAWLQEKHKEVRERLRQKFEAKKKAHAIEDPVDVSPSVALPILMVAQLESRDELLDLWAALLLAASDPKSAEGYRFEFMDIVRGLDPTDVRVLVDPHIAAALAVKIALTSQAALASRQISSPSRSATS